jgi:DNA-binding transcriptional LysR family regulator
LTRTTRAIVLTEGDSEYLTRIEPLLDALEEANQAARGTGELRGVLRLALPISIGGREIVPRLPRFLPRHPSLRMDLLLDDGRQHLVREGMDVALRFGELTDSSDTARFIGMNQRLLAAPPAYLRRAGKPSSPAELANHALIIGPPGPKLPSGAARSVTGCPRRSRRGSGNGHVLCRKPQQDGRPGIASRAARGRP